MSTDRCCVLDGERRRRRPTGRRSFAEAATSSRSKDHDIAAANEPWRVEVRAPADSSSKRLVQAGGDLLDVERAQARRRQFDRQRKPVETTDDLGDRSPARRGRGRTAGHGTCSLDEQVEPPARRQSDVGSGGTTYTCSPDTRSRSRLVAIDRHVGTADEETIDQVGDRVEDVLAVVEQQHHLGVRQHRRQPLGQQFSGATVDGQGGGDDVDGGLRAGGRQLAHHHGALRASRLQAVTGLDEQPGLAHPAWTDQRQQAPVLRQGEDLLHRLRSALERRDRQR